MMRFGVRSIWLMLLFAFATTTKIVKGNIADFDEYWQQRAAESKNASREAYNHHPEGVTDHANSEVHKALEGAAEDKRRHLREKVKGRRSCLANNPIDRCWRCNPNWAKNRKKLAGCALGFGRTTMGGKDGEFYVVTSAADDDMVNPKPGTLRYGVIQKRPLWITFKHDMVIRLSQELMITSDKTLDGRGANVHIAYGAQITIQYVKNVIIHNLHIHDIKQGNGGFIRDSVNHYGFRTTSDGDGVSIFGASQIWVDHCSFSSCYDGIVDAIEGSTAITISNNHITNHNEVHLFGASDAYSEDSVMQITVAFNHFGRGLVQRMPRCRWGFVHVLNNDYTHWEMYAIGGSMHPTIYSHGNRFIAPNNTNCKEVTKRDYATQSIWKSWDWRSEEDLMMNGAFFVESGRKIKQMDGSEVIKAKPGSYVSRLTRYSGALNCIEGKPC